MSTSASRREFVAAALGIAATTAATRVSAETAATTSAAPTTDERKRLLHDLIAAGGEPDSQAAVAEVLRRALADRAYLTKAIGDPAGPGIHALHRSAQLTVLNVIWSPRMVLRPHNHNMWANIGVYSGREDNIFWRKSAATIVAERASAIGENDVLRMPGDVIHSVINPIDRLTGALHVYGGDFFAPGRSEWDPGSLSEQPWSLERAARAFKEANACFEAGQNTASAG